MIDVKSNSNGSFDSVEGIVKRWSDVMPYINIAVYACLNCINEVYQVIFGTNIRFKNWMPKY